MPSVVRRLLIFAAIDGLVLQPAPPRNHPPATQQAIKIEYKTHGIAPLLKDRREEETPEIALEAHGVIGLLKLASSSFLVSISDREQVAQLRGKPVYTITDVALIPLSSQSDAEKAIVQARERLKQNFRVDDSDDSSGTEILEDEDLSQSAVEEEPQDTTTAVNEETTEDVPPPGSQPRRTSIAEDVIKKKGKYGRFAERWFSKRGWSNQGRRMQGMSSEDSLVEGKESQKAKRSSSAGATDSNVESEGGKQMSPIPDDLNKPTSPEGALPDPKIPGAFDAEDKSKQLSPLDNDPEVLPNSPGESAVALLPKIIRTTKLFFSSRSFFFSYEYDISKKLAKQTQHSSLPLYESFDPLFFWNKNLADPFLESGQQTFIMPLIQGFVGQRAFSMSVSPETSESTVVDASTNTEDAMQAQTEAIAGRAKQSEDTETRDQKKDFLLTLISRRSVKRAGLRYLRCGVDEEGNTANFVESEQLLSSASWDSSKKVHSFIQIRGSIPLFFSQSPYSLKPVPIFHGSHETNAAAFKKHFQALTARYGSLQVASLVDKHGTEAKIGQAYEKAASSLNESSNGKGGIDDQGTQLAFEWFDFHYVCRGMKFENVSQLMDILSSSRSAQGWTEQQDDRIISTQNGVLRTNCMDCLDRTNVVQAATALRVLEAQLTAEEIPGVDLHATEAPTAWFNTLWADNGDAISKQYAGTAALKGDYTRTKRRNISGALTDFGLTLNRYYNNVVNDYFAQALIDYLVGRANLQVFSDFESDMRAQDYAVDLRKVRQAAIETCTKIVMDDADGEDLVAGWTLSCPAQRAMLRGGPFEECVLLLSDRALYFCRFDWGTEKVREFERIVLSRLQALRRGAYITSTLTSRQMDTSRNVGFIVRYDEAESSGELVRRNTRSLDSSEVVPEADDAARGKTEKGKKGDSGRKESFLAFKALPPRSSYVSLEGQDATEPLSEVDMVQSICDEIRRVAVEVIDRRAASSGARQMSRDAHDMLPVEEEDIISVADAKKSTGYLEQLGYSLKKLVWA